MTKLWRMLVAHLKEDFDLRCYISIFLFLVISLTINYTLSLENGIIDRYNGKAIRILWYFLLYATAYYGTCVLMWISRRSSLFSNRSFMIFSLAGVALLAVAMGFPYLTPLLRLMVKDYRMFTWSYQVATNLTSFILATIPMWLLAQRFEKGKREHLGLTPRFNVTPYLILLALIVPVIAVAALEQGLGSYYPTYKSNFVADVMHWPKWVPVFIYEFVYALDFFNVEFLFRGFMVVGLSRFAGKDVIMPMAVTYCFLHFGKPVGEAISSIFGGYVLGVIAMYTRSVWGGVILHVGVALTMEIAAFAFKT